MLPKIHTFYKGQRQWWWLQWTHKVGKGTECLWVMFWSNVREEFSKGVTEPILEGGMWLPGGRVCQTEGRANGKVPRWAHAAQGPPRIRARVLWLENGALRAESQRRWVRDEDHGQAMSFFRPWMKFGFYSECDGRALSGTVVFSKNNSGWCWVRSLVGQERKHRDQLSGCCNVWVCLELCHRNGEKWKIRGFGIYSDEKADRICWWFEFEAGVKRRC